jgi:hypothetical protein
MNASPSVSAIPTALAIPNRKTYFECKNLLNPGVGSDRKPQCSWPDAQAGTESRRLPAPTIGEMNLEHRRLLVTANLQGTR